MRGVLKWTGIGCGGLVALFLVVGVVGAIAGGGVQEEQVSSGNDGSNSASSGSSESGSGNGSQSSQAGSGDQGESDASSGGEQGGNPQAGIGEQVQDGSFAFTVTGVEQAQTLGQEMMSSEAQGKYVIVNLSVQNVGDEAGTFNAGSSQVAFDSQGREYQTSEDAIMSGEGSDDSSFLQQINPGSSVDGRLVYDVPEQTQLTEVELHGGTFSSGAQVALQ